MSRATPAGLVALAATLAGVGVSTYLTLAHYAHGMTLACPATHLVNCERVTTSPESVIAGVPVAVLGLAYFLAMTGLVLPGAWGSAAPRLHQVRAALAGLGVAMVLYLVWTELFTLDAICLWCTSVHVLTLIVFALSVFRLAGQPTGGERAGQPSES